MALALFSGVTFDSPRKANGDINAGGKVYFYEPGTSTAKDAYTTSSLTVATTNPLILDAYGMGTAWLNGSYKIRVTDSADVLLPNGEEDNYNKGSSFGITAYTGAQTMVGVDDTGSFTHSGTYTVSLTQASTLGAGWFTDHYNIGTGVITFARLAAGDTIDGTAANFTLQPGEFVRVMVNSGTTGFVTVISKRDLYATAAGTDTYTCTFAPPNIGRYSGQKLRVRFTNANATTTPTLNGVTITKEGSAALVAGDIPAGHEADLTDNGTNYVLGNPKPSAASITSGTISSAVSMYFGSMIRTEVSAAALIVDCGTVVAGDKILCLVHETIVISGSGLINSRYTIGKPSGTATATLLNGVSSFFYNIDGDTALSVNSYPNIFAIYKVTVGGTLTVGITGVVTGTTGTAAVTTSNPACHAIVLRNG